MRFHTVKARFLILWVSTTPLFTELTVTLSVPLRRPLNQNDAKRIEKARSACSSAQRKLSFVGAMVLKPGQTILQCVDRFSHTPHIFSIIPWYVRITFQIVSASTRHSSHTRKTFLKYDLIGQNCLLPMRHLQRRLDIDCVLSSLKRLFREDI